jgi:hypothetical protein
MKPIIAKSNVCAKDVLDFYSRVISVQSGPSIAKKVTAAAPVLVHLPELGTMGGIVERLVRR